MYSATPGDDNASSDPSKKRRPRVGDTRTNMYDNRDNLNQGGRPSYGNNRGRCYNQGGAYNQGGGTNQAGGRCLHHPG